MTNELLAGLLGMAVLFWVRDNQFIMRKYSRFVKRIKRKIGR